MVAFLHLVPLVLLSAAPMPPPQAVCDFEQVAPTILEAPVLAAFDRRISAYMDIHNDVERRLAPQQMFEDAEEMFEALEILRSAISASRADARPGDLFTDDVAALIRARLRARLEACNQTVEDVLAYVNEERLPGTRPPTLHEPLPWGLGSAMPAALIPALPRLPDELQYRFADRDLVLIDIHAGMVVDILVDALPGPSDAS